MNEETQNGEQEDGMRQQAVGLGEDIFQDETKEHADESQLAIDFSSMPNTHDKNRQDSILNIGDYTIIANPIFP